MASGEASFRRQLTDSFKAAIQELRDEKGARDGTFASSLEKLVGSVRPLPFVWGNPQVAKEPHWWLLMLHEKEYEAANVVDDHGLHGKVTQGLALSLLEGHRRACVPCNDYVRDLANRIVEEFIQVYTVFTALGVTGDGMSAIMRLTPILSRASNLIDLLERDVVKKALGSKEATRFMRNIRANDRMFAQRNGYAIRGSMKVSSGSNGPSSTFSDTDLTRETPEDVSESRDQGKAPKATKKAVKPSWKKKRR